MTTEARWTPALDTDVWFNYPDANEPMGKVVAFVEDGPREGQPIIRKPNGDRVICHPVFLLPFRYGSDEWWEAHDDGRIK